jgi:hypothetical protein
MHSRRRLAPPKSLKGMTTRGSESFFFRRPGVELAVHSVNVFLVLPKLTVTEWSLSLYSAETRSPMIW